MARGKTWKGFDYVSAKPVELPRAEWRERIAQSSKTAKATGDTLIFSKQGDQHTLVAEVYTND